MHETQVQLHDIRDYWGKLNKSKLFELQARGKKKVNIGKEEGKIRFIWKIEEFSDIFEASKGRSKGNGTSSV